MHKVNYNLRSPSSSSMTSIVLLITYGGRRLRMSTHEKIAGEAWDKLRQRPLKTKTNEYQMLNERLDILEQFIQNIIQRSKDQQFTLSLPSLKKEVENFILQSHNVQKTIFFWGKYHEFIDFKNKTTSSGKEYEYVLKKHLKCVEKNTGIPLTFEAFKYAEGGFIDHLKTYFTLEAANKKGERGLSVNSIWKHFKNIRVFLNWCFDQNYVTKFSTKHIQTKNEQVYNVYLTKNELLKLENLKLSGEENTVRDLFLISCETGLRFSDLCELKPQHIQAAQFEVFPKKTRKNDATRKVIIPFSQRVQRIVEEYAGRIPTYAYSRISNYNKILRTLCLKAEIDAPCFHYRIVQGKESVIESKKYELVSSHTGRRTFCTLKFLDGMPAHVIMKFSGHTSEQNFLRYLKLDAELTAEKYRDFF